MKRSIAARFILATGLILLTVGWLVEGAMSDALSILAFVMLFLVLPLFAAFLSFVERAQSEASDESDRRLGITDH